VTSTCVVGLQWGDEAKGKIVDVLTDEHDIVVRFQGGSNAGHTVVRDGKKYKFSLIPTGILHPGKIGVIAGGVVIDPISLLAEIESLRSAGVEIAENLLISDRAHVIFPYHRQEEVALEGGGSGDKRAIGTTMRGIGPCYRDKASRVHGIRIGDLFRPASFERRVRGIIDFKNASLAGLASAARVTFLPINADEVIRQYTAAAERLRPHVIDSTDYLHSALAAGKRLLFEGAQGTLLDVDHGSYPFVTSSSSSACGLSAGSGVPAQRVGRFLGIIKAYTTRVGEGPFPTELLDATGDLIRNTGREFGTVTGRPRRCGWFDAVLARYSARICGVTGVAVMLLDVLSELDEIKICTEYEHEGRRIMTVPACADVLGECKPVYISKPGWNCDISQAKALTDLPRHARDYLDTISQLLSCPIDVVSIGPDRNQTIRVK
jgi:adenylosuccinate synthase